MPRLPSRFRLSARHLSLALALTAPLLGACGGEDEPVAPPPPAAANVFLTDANNYTSVSVLDIPFTETTPEADLDIYWDGIAEDLQCHDVTDIDNITFLRFDNKTEAEVAAMLVEGEMPSNAYSDVSDFQPADGSTQTQLSTFDFVGTPINLSEITENPEGSYLLLFAEGTLAGVGTKTMMFVRPTSGSDNKRVDAETGCEMLDFDADIVSKEVAEIPADGPFVVDWKAVTQDALGNDFAYTSVNSLLVGFYEDMTVQEVEDRIFDLEEMATSIYELPLSGVRQADLTKAVERTTDENFAGFDRTNGVWMLALRCTTCQNPQPLLLTVLEPI